MEKADAWASAHNAYPKHHSSGASGKPPFPSRKLSGNGGKAKEDTPSSKYHQELPRSKVNFAEVLDEVSSEDCTWEDGRTTCIEELEDDYAGLPITPDGQTDNKDPRAQIDPNLDPEQRTALLELLQEYGDLFSEIPGYTTTIEHDIILDTTGRIRSKLVFLT
ncbi:hypothetical protein Pmani_024138 [Petrolisthes manimaculis]|uniref:Uncharacterized protein n=1 Tax=Petrolisthes manimaculis TaxID=1843537 RepID=A0AAE1TZ03_9EUCA|nr:hypothetical protein Pmani_024138 [Petrolisthes manimaculis]